jgi:hypothetical protein
MFYKLKQMILQLNKIGTKIYATMFNLSKDSQDFRKTKKVFSFSSNIILNNQIVQF